MLARPAPPIRFGRRTGPSRSGSILSGLGVASTRDPDALSRKVFAVLGQACGVGHRRRRSSRRDPARSAGRRSPATGSRRCSTMTTVGLLRSAKRRTAARTVSAASGSSIEVGSSSSSSGRRGPGFRPGPAAASRPPTAQPSGGRRRTGNPSRSGPSRRVARWLPVARARFSSPNATSRPTVCATIAARGSCRSRPMPPAGLRGIAPVVGDAARTGRRGRRSAAGQPRLGAASTCPHRSGRPAGRAGQPGCAGRGR